MKITQIANGVELEVSDERGNCVKNKLDVEHQEAKSPQQEARKRVLAKTGNTIYNVVDVIDELGEMFIPASLLTELRRDTLELLDEVHAKARVADVRREEDVTASLPQGNTLTYHDNVANSLAKKFYMEHGATKVESAVEVSDEKIGEGLVVMNTRYCLRRELGYCLKTPKGKEWVAPLYIQTGNNRFCLDFDCKGCRMKVIYLG